MKKHIIRRVGARLPALVLALVLAAGMTAPALAASAGGTSSGTSAPSLKLSGAATITQDPGEMILTATLTNAPEDAVISWSIEPKEDHTKAPTTPPELTPGAQERDENDTVTGTVTLNSTRTGPGEFTLKASYTDQDGEHYETKNVIISGIVLTGAKVKGTGPLDKSLEMHMNETAVLTVDVYGAADDRGVTTVEWDSKSPSVVSVPVNSGTLMAWQLGKGVVITAVKGKYRATCTVDVVEDLDVIAGPFTITSGEYLNLYDALGELKNMARIKTEKLEAGVTTWSELDYITNLSVPTSQGTLYYNYVSEGDTGAGVGSAERYAESPNGAIRGIDTLYFVPKKGFRGVAEITFNGWAKDGTNFAGTIKVAVSVTTTDKDGNEVGDNGPIPIGYGTRSGEPVFFMTRDFNAYFQSVTGRNMNHVTFNLPQTSQGTLYYNYIGGSGTPVSTTTQFSRYGRYTVDDVCFVPNPALASDGEKAVVTIYFRGTDTSGASVSGEVKVTVTPSSASSDPANVYISGERGKPVVLESNLFNKACRDTIDDALSHVSFRLPAPSEGTLYYNYRSDGSFDSRVSAATLYHYSGVPGISGVAFVPADDDVVRVAIPYTGYGSAGTSFTGTLYVSFGEEDRTTIRYYVSKNSSVAFSASDFSVAGLYQMGVGVEYVELEVPYIDPDDGALYYDYRGGNSYNWTAGTGIYYISPIYGWESRLGLISFHAEDAAGTIIIPYKAYSAADSSYNRKSFTGRVVIQVGSDTPEDVRLSCNNCEQVRLSSYDLSSVCRQAMDEGLAYIEITSVPAAEKGRLYLNYNGFGTGTAVKEGDRFHTTGSPGISQLCFVPRAGFSGEAEITYIGYSYSNDAHEQEQVSGRIVVKVAKSRTSRFTDMGGHAWAIDSVEYLRRSGTVTGIGDGRFDPTGIMTRGDFTLMLVRACRLTASGSASFNDVPPGSYYADAIRVAALLGIAGGSNGNYNPKAPITRQDAMVMICNALKAVGKTLTNGLAADFSVYRDEGEIAPYAREAMGILVQMGVVKGNGSGYLLPRGLLSRAEAAVLLHTIMTL